MAASAGRGTSRKGLAAGRFAAGPVRLARECDGVTALEFALLVVPFLGLTFALIETALLTFADAILQGGVTTAARQIRTGQIQDTGGCPASAGDTAVQAFLTTLRNQMAGPIDPAKLYVDVNNFTSFGTINLPAPVVDSSGKVTNTCFNTGGAGAVVSVRVLYVWHALTPGLSALLGAAADQDLVLQHTVVFRNEPY